MRHLWKETARGTALDHLGKFFCLLMLAVTLTVLGPAPVGTLFGWSAYADDDDDGGGGASNAGGSGASSSGSNNSTLEFLFQQRKRSLRPKRERRPRAERRVPRQQVERRSPRQPTPLQVRRTRVELVAMLDIGTSGRELIANDFEILDRRTLPFVALDMLRLRSLRRESSQNALRRLRLIEAVRAADRNHLYRTSELSCTAADCPTFEMIGWAAPPDSCLLDVTIGMIDTGIAADHEALAGQRMERLSTRSKDRAASSLGHGTAVAALLIGRTDGPHPGLLPRARLVAVDAFHAATRGEDMADAFDLVAALEILASRRVRVFNLSLAGPDNVVLRLAVEALLHQDFMLVAAVGNGGAKAPAAFPAAYDGVIAVTAIDREQKLFRRANNGAHVDVAAPGVNLDLASTGTRKRLRSGTSFAVPFVSAVIALERHKSSSASNPRLDLARITKDLGEPGKDKKFGWGVIAAAGRCNTGT